MSIAVSVPRIAGFIRKVTTAGGQKQGRKDAAEICDLPISASS
jgi:hypothetical protein